MISESSRGPTPNRPQSKEVWQTPSNQLASKYGISNVGLAKICRKLNVPTPPRGYWAKLEYGYQVERVPLPELKPDQPDCHILEVARDKPKLGNDARRLVVREKGKSAQIRIPKTLNNPHPLVLKTRDVVSAGNADDYGFLRPRRKNKYQCLNVVVTKGSLGRALRIMNAVIRAFEARGFTVLVRETNWPGTYVEILGEQVPFFLKERVRRVDHVPTPKEKKDRYSYWHKYDYLPTGNLSLTIDSWRTGDTRKTWADGSSQRIDDLLNSFIAATVKVADFMLQDRLEREELERQRLEEQRRREELERQRLAEQKRIQDLENQAVRWEKSKRLRAYIAEVKTVTFARGDDGDSRAKLDLWVEWASQHADRLDPLANGLPF